MHFKSHRELEQNNHGTAHSTTFQSIIVLLLFVAAFGIRLHHISKPPLDFSPVRQYQGAHNARGYYYENLDSVPEWRKEIAAINMKRMGFVLEPRILEYMTVKGYRIAGGEYLWIPRVLSSIFWIVGGIFLFLIARHISSSGAALFSTAFYLFLPYGISSSRTIQPDPLMTLMLLFSIFMIIKYYERPSWQMLISAAVVSSVAMLIKPYTLFLIYGAFLFIDIHRQGVRKALLSYHNLVFVLLSFLPTAYYYVFGILFNVGYLGAFAQASFLPHLLLTKFFWMDWFKLIGQVTGYIPFICAIIGFFMIQHRLSKALLSGLWIGYFVFGLVFDYHIHTHSYYHMQFIPVVALSLGPIGVWAIGLARQFFSGKRMIYAGMIFLALVIIVGLNIRKVQLNDYKEQLKTVGSFIGINPQFHKFLTGDFEKEVKVAQDIGEIVKHNTNTVFLTPFFGRFIAYHGDLAGLPWPTALSLQGRREKKLRIPPKEELLNTNYIMLRTPHYLVAKIRDEYIKYTPDFFIITAFDEYEKQPELKSFLESNFPLIAQDEYYLIFDLRKMTEVKQ